MNLKKKIETIKNINSKTSLLLSVLFLVICILFYTQTQKKYEKNKNELIAYQEIGAKFKTLKESYKNKNEIVENLTTILKNQNIQNGNIETKNNIVTLDIEKIDSKKLGNILNLILNKKYNIVKLNTQNSSLTLEIKGF